MSDYDPFTRPAPASEAQDEIYDPFRKRPQERPEPTGPVQTPKREKEMEAPPGLGEVRRDVSFAPVKFSAAVLQGIGGLLFVAALLSFVAFQTTIEAEAVTSRYGDDHDSTPEIEEARSIVVPLLFVGAALFLTAGTGILMQQAWARIMGAILLFMAGLGSFWTVAVPALCIAAAVPLLRTRYAGWYR